MQIGTVAVMEIVAFRFDNLKAVEVDMPFNSHCPSSVRGRADLGKGQSILSSTNS